MWISDIDHGLMIKGAKLSFDLSRPEPHQTRAVFSLYLRTDNSAESGVCNGVQQSFSAKLVANLMVTGRVLAKL